MSINDIRMSGRKCIEGFGCPNNDRLKRFAILVCAVALAAYLCSTKTVEENPIGVQAGGFIGSSFSNASVIGHLI